jgi:2-phosphosulfolactate phosphatase
VYYDQSAYDIRCEWGLHAIEHLGPSADVIVLIDVLSFSTCVDIATSRGASILPYRFKDSTAQSFADQNNAILAGPRGGSAPYSLSPASLQSIEPNTRLVLPSPNGSALPLAAAEHGRPVIAACLRNATAVGRHARTLGRSILLVPAGERWPDDSVRPAVEDLIGAGAVIDAISGSRSPEARIAHAAFIKARTRLAESLLHCASGRELTEKGYAQDVHLAAAHDTSTAVPLFDDLAYRGALA